MVNPLIILLVIITAVLTVAAKTNADRKKCETSNREIDLQRLEIVRFNTKARLISQIEAGKLDGAKSNLRKLQMLNDKEEELLV